MTERDGAAGADGASTSNDGASASSSPPRKHPWRWHPSRARHHESDSHPTWLRRRRHLFIVSDAGKPLWSRYGGEDSLAGFTAALSAIVAFVGDDGDALRSVGWLGSTARASGGDGRRPPRRPHELTVLRRGPIVLAAMTSTGESPAALRRQLHLLHAQLIALLTRAVERALTRSSKFDARGRLLGGGTDALLGTLAHRMTWDPGAWMRAWAPLPLPPRWREKCVRALRDGLVRVMGGVGAGALLGVLLTDRHVAAIANADARAGKSATSSSSSSSSSSSYSSPGGGDRGAQGTLPRGRGRYYAGIDPDDVITLCNTVRSGASFRANEESFAPVCLPNYDADGFAFAYVAYLRTSGGEVGGGGEDEPGGRGIDSRDGGEEGRILDDGTSKTRLSSKEEEGGVCLVLVSTSRDAFPAAAEARARIEETLRREGLLDRIAARVCAPEAFAKSGSRSSSNVGQASDETAGETAAGDSIPGSISIARDVPPAAGGGNVAGTPLLHFVYLRPPLGQYAVPDWSPPLHRRREQKRLLRTYQRVFHSMSRWWPSEREWDDDPYGGVASGARGASGDAAEAGSPLAAFFSGLRISSGGGSGGDDGGDAARLDDGGIRDRRVHYEVCDDHVLLGCVGSDFELYVALDPLTRRSAAVAVCNRLCAWLRAEEAGLFAVC